ncbi:MAG: methyltransferase regulatory domain-containing protein [Terriglobia bacterium]
MGNSASPASPAQANSYDQVLYPGVSFRQSHPDRLATQAMMFGMSPAPVESCRVLELGCGSGGNLLPIAFGLPGSECTGIDLAARPVEQAQAKARALGLRNVTLRQMDLRDIAPGFGTFDYIIAHGLYSWVPADVQRKLLALCSANLAPQGVAYVSYNAYPGSHVREMLRGMMLYAARGVDDPRERVSRGLDLIQSLIESLKPSDPFRVIIEPERDRMREVQPESLFHDDFNEFYLPVYFYEFIGRAEGHGLQYLGEAALAAMWIAQVSLFGQRDLAGLDVIRGEQMLDFRMFRNFRATLLCHKEVKLDRSLKPERVRPLWASSAVKPESPAPDLTSQAEETFRLKERKLGLKVTTNHPLTKAALWLLGSRWPGRMKFNELEARALEVSQSTREARSGPLLEQVLLNMYGSQMVELHSHEPALSERAGERPLASALARLMLRQGSYVTNLRHEGIDLEDEALRRLILLLDGTRDRTALLEALKRERASAASEADRPLNDHADPQTADLKKLEESLQKIARMAVLMA